MRTKLVFALGLALVVSAFAGTDALLAPSRSDVSDATGSPRLEAPTPWETDFDYTMEWTINLNHIGVVGLTPVQDTLLWVSSGGRTSSADPNWILIFDIRTQTLIDSFQQAVTNTWGWRDMCYDPVEDVVYAGTDGNRLDKINPNSHQVIQTYTVSGSPTPGIVRALGFDGDSLYSANFSTSPVVKFSTTGTNSHQVAPIPPLAIYGIAIDESRGMAYASTGDYSRRIIEYTFPAWTVVDSTLVTEADLFGGCEMWGTDFLLAINQGTPDQVLCMRLSGGGVSTDVGVNSILAPTGNISPGPVAPKARIKNFGTDPQSDIPVVCMIDSAGSNVYSETETYAGPLAPGATADVTFPNWTAVNGTYDVTMYTELVGDENRSNDTMMGTATVAAAVWEPIPAPSSTPDRIVHSTVWDPGTDQVFIIGGNPAGATGTYDGKCQAYDPNAMGWTVKAPMPTPLGWCGYGRVGDKIYMIGGHNNTGGFVGTNQEYDIASNTWSTKAARPGTAVAAPLSATWNDSLIYIMGGLATSAERRVDIYDPASNSWMVGTQLPLGAYMGSAVCVGDTIYAVNAYSGTCWPNLYKGYIDPANPASINWIMGPANPTPVFNGATVAVGGDIYWIGGFQNATTVTNQVWKYSQSTGAITRFSPDYLITLARCTFAAVRENVDGDEIYVMGGDMNGDWSAPNQTYAMINFGGVGVEEQPPVVLRSTIDAVSPSVVSNVARISYTIGQTGNVRLGVYDVTGKLVRSLVDGTVTPGTRTSVWDRTDGNGRQVANGTYFFRLTVEGQSVSAKSVVLD